MTLSASSDTDTLLRLHADSIPDVVPSTTTGRIDLPVAMFFFGKVNGGNHGILAPGHPTSIVRSLSAIGINRSDEPSKCMAQVELDYKSPRCTVRISSFPQPVRLSVENFQCCVSNPKPRPRQPAPFGGASSSDVDPSSLARFSKQWHTKRRSDRPHNEVSAKRRHLEIVCSGYSSSHPNSVTLLQ